MKKDKANNNTTTTNTIQLMHIRTHCICLLSAIFILSGYTNKHDTRPKYTSNQHNENFPSEEEDESAMPWYIHCILTQ